MAAKLFYRTGGVLRQITKLFYRDPAGGGTLRNIQKAFYRDGGVLRQVFAVSGGSPAAVAFSNQAISQSGTLANQTAGYRINASGIAEKRQRSTYTTLETWLVSGLNTDVEIRATATGDTDRLSGVVGAWYTPSTSEEWSLAAGAGEALAVTLSFEVRPAGGGANIDAWTVTLDSERF